MIFRLAFLLVLLFCAALPGAEKSKEQVFTYTRAKPCHLDKYKKFCCPVAKMVRRGSTDGKWTDYFYNDRDELIGLRKSDYSGSVHKSTFTALGGNCSRCGDSRMTVSNWTHNTAPKLAPAKSKKKK